jgi:hypothetical protein
MIFAYKSEQKYIAKFDELLFPTEAKQMSAHDSRLKKGSSKERERERNKITIPKFHCVLKTSCR